MFETVIKRHLKNRGIPLDCLEVEHNINEVIFIIKNENELELVNIIMLFSSLFSFPKVRYSYTVVGKANSDRVDYVSFIVSCSEFEKLNEYFGQK